MRDHIQAALKKHTKYSDSTCYTAAWVVNRYVHYLREAIIRGYPIDIPYVGMIKLFAIKTLDKNDKFGNVWNKSVNDPSVTFRLLARGRMFDRFQYDVRMEKRMMKEFNEKYANTELFYKLLGSDEKNRYTKSYY